MGRPDAPWFATQVGCLGRHWRGLNHMAKSARNSDPSTIVKRTVLRRAPNSELRPREYLTEKEIERLQDAARKRSRYGHRDATMILLTYRHGLRASEVCSLRWDQIELESGRLHVRRAKGGIDNVHPLSGKEIRALRQLRREDPGSRYVFITERGGPATTAGFLKTIARTGEAAGRALLRRGKRHRGTARIAAQGM
jgi:integrase